jgi:hypothetical protein
MAWLALPIIKRTQMWSVEMPNAWNFGFSYYITCILVMLSYIPGVWGDVLAVAARQSACHAGVGPQSMHIAPAAVCVCTCFPPAVPDGSIPATCCHCCMYTGLPQLYGYMLTQRKKVLGGGAAPKSKAA